MKKTIYSLFFACLLLVACSNDTSQENEADVESKVDTSKATEEVNLEKEEVTEDEKEDIAKEKAEVTGKTTLTKDEFNQLFEIDPEETQYENGLFELSDGSTVNADFLSYGESDLFAYATAIFYEDKLANVQFETDKSQEEIVEALGIVFDENTTVEVNRIGYEINFNDMFNEANISIYPFEMD